ncbi:PLP-dependent aminotransferase family protein [Mesorhizobium sp. M0859]|uniref:aminotransferase-like domain-containing protein n=1 Tax=Mesorhizobium sp. M0859 TaxID=2957014 RepID=UPI0033359009
MDDLPKVQKANQVVGSLIDFGRNFPPPSPIVELAIADSFAHLQKTDIASAIRFPRFTGTEKDRRAGAAWLSRRLGQQPEADRIVLANGSQSILAMLMARYVKPGGILLTEALTYPAIKPLSAMFNIRLHGVAIDDEGIMPDSLDEECGRLHGNTGALYCMPTLHNPTSATMSDGRRQDIAKIARRHDLAIFEDDIYGVLPTDAPPPLATYAPERSWYFVGLSKSLASQLRVAYVLAPSRALGEGAFWPGVRTTNWMVAPLVAEIASHWVLSGLANDILQSVRAETEERKRLAVSRLPTASIHPESLNYHLWLDLPEHASLADFVMSARQAGVIVGAGDSFAVNNDRGDRKFRIGLGVPANQNSLIDGLDAIASLFSVKG